jgi:hypothetical protein
MWSREYGTHGCDWGPESGDLVFSTSHDDIQQQTVINNINNIYNAVTHLDGYLQVYRTDRAKPLQLRPAQAVDDYKWTAYTTWGMSVERLTSTTAKFLRLFTFLHHGGIPRTTITDKFPYIGDASQLLGRHRIFSENGGSSSESILIQFRSNYIYLT